MSDLIKTIRDNLMFSISKAIENKVDGKELTKKLDEIMDDKFGEGLSENLQREVITNLLLEMVEGLWLESPNQLRAYMYARYKLAKKSD